MLLPLCKDTTKPFTDLADALKGECKQCCSKQGPLRQEEHRNAAET